MSRADAGADRPSAAHALGLYLVVMTLFVALAPFLVDGSPAAQAGLTSIGIVLLPALVWTRGAGWDPRSAFDWRGGSPTAIGGAALVAIATFLLLSEALVLVVRMLGPEASEFWDAREIMRRERQMLEQQSVLVSAVMMAALPALCEEACFRGVIRIGLQRSLAPGRAIVLSAALFAVLHVVPVRIAATFVLGLVFGGIARARGLAAAITAHAVNNLMVVGCAQWPVTDGGGWLKGEDHVPWPLLATAALMACAGIGLLRRDPAVVGEGR